METSIAITEMTVSELAAEWLMLVQNRIKASTYANYSMKLRRIMNLMHLLKKTKMPVEKPA